MARKLSRQAMLTLLNTAGLDDCTVPTIAEQAGIAENALRKKARKAVEQGALNFAAESVWRGWLHMNGPVAQTTPPTTPAEMELLLGPEEALTFRTLPEPLPEAERVAMGDVPEAGMAPAHDETPLMPLDKPKRRSPSRRRQTMLWLRMTALPLGCTYDDVMRAYLGERTIRNPEWQLRHYVLLKANAKGLPDHVVHVVVSHSILGSQTFHGVPMAPKPEAPATISGLLHRVTTLEARADTAASRQRRMDTMLEVLGREVDMIVDDLGLAEQPSKPFFQDVILFLPRLTVNTGTRILKASRAFVRVMLGREPSGTGNGDEKAGRD